MARAPTVRGQQSDYYRKRRANSSRYGERTVNAGRHPCSPNNPCPPARPSRRSRERTKSVRKRWNASFGDQQGPLGPAYCFYRNGKKLCVPSANSTYNNKSVRSCTRTNKNNCRKQKTSEPRYYDTDVYTKAGKWKNRIMVPKRRRGEQDEPPFGAI